MNCVECRELLVGYIEKLLDVQQGEMVRSHLKDCHDCRKELKQIIALQNRLVADGAARSQETIENAVMDRIVREQAFQLRKTNQVKQDLNFWRFIMRSPITKLAMAAVVIIAAGLAIYYFAGEGTKRCCAWERIADKVEQFKTCIYTMHIQQTGGPLGQKGQQIEAKVYLSSDYGYKMETMLEGKVMQQMYMPVDGNAMVMVMPTDKKYMRMVLTDEVRAKVKNQTQDPRTIVTQMVSGISGQHKELGKDTINGVEVQGIEVNNPPAVQGLYNSFIGRLWVDVATQYPVRVEIEAEIGTGEQKINMLMVMDGFEWGTELSPDLFKPDIPADYTMMAEVKMPGQDEASAIEGLRIFAEMADGRYPSQMNVMTLTKESAEMYGKKLGAKGTKPTDEQMQQVTATMVKFQAPVLFYSKLSRDGNDPAYYGKDVKAGDANTVLMRWKISDGTYKVIYGDLSAENVTAEKLKQMEQAAQK